jgi:hypothetical protein
VLAVGAVLAVGLPSVAISGVVVRSPVGRKFRLMTRRSYLPLLVGGTPRTSVGRADLLGQ